MHIALCFSGELRSIQHSFPKIKEYIIDPIGDSYDVFYHTWDDDPHLSDINVFVKDGHLRDILIESRLTFDEKKYNTRKRSEVNVQGFLRQLYCLKRCNQLKNSMK